MNQDMEAVANPDESNWSLTVSSNFEFTSHASFLANSYIGDSDVGDILMLVPL